jgi:hypothetical protein
VLDLEIDIRVGAVDLKGSTEETFADLLPDGKQLDETVVVSLSVIGHPFQEGGDSDLLGYLHCLRRQA